MAQFPVGKQDQQLVETQMQRHGFKLCNEQPDLMLHFQVVVENKIYFASGEWCEETLRTNMERCPRLKPIHYQEGTLLIDFIDTKKVTRFGAAPRWA